MSDEGRLRQLFRDQVETVPILANLEDVASRAGHRLQGHGRALVGVTVLALVVGSLAGFSAGRIGRGSSRPTIATGAAPTDDSTGAGPGGNDANALMQRVFVRTTADGVTMRVYRGRDDVVQKHTNASVSSNQVMADLSTDAVVGFDGATFPSGEPTKAIGTVTAAQFGLVEGAPAAFVIVQVRSDVARVRATFGDGASDEMQPINGVAVLAGVGAHSAVTIEALDAQGHVQDTRTVSSVEPKSVTTVPAVVATTPTLPAPGAQQPADVAAATLQVDTAFAGAFDGSASNATRSAAIEGGTELVSVFDALRHGAFATSVLSAKTVIDGVVFVSATSATVEFHSNLASGSTSGPYFANATLTAAGWQVSRASYCRIVEAADAHCP